MEAGMKMARRIAAMENLAAIGGMATVVLAFATGNVPMMIAAGAFIFGAAALPVVAQAVSAVLEARRERQASSASEAPGRDVQPDIQECLAEIKAFYARRGKEPESGGGRFRELVSTEPEAGCDRLR
jgi:hypothetical protein